jgi:hypothetical protein
MIIYFDRDLTSETIYANGDELAIVLGRDKDADGNRVYSWPREEKEHLVTFQDPVLVTDNYRIGNLPPFNKAPVKTDRYEASRFGTRDNVFRLFEFPVRTTIYDGTSLEFEQQKYPGLWGPSIDTLLACYGTRLLDLDDVRTMCELGSGSGFWTKDILANNINLLLAHTIDLNPASERCIRDTVHDIRLIPKTGDAIAFLEGKRYDRLFCNPPYLPRPKSIDDNPYEGISLFAYLILHGQEHLTRDGSVVTNISSLCEHLTDPLIRKAGVNVRKIATREVPLKVFNVLNNKEWMAYLLDHGLRHNPHDGYEFWQTINIVELRS